VWGADAGLRLTILGNTIRRAQGGGISISAAAVTTLDALIEGNDIGELGAISADGIAITAGESAGDVPTVCLEITENIAVGMDDGLQLISAANSPVVGIEGWDGTTDLGDYLLSDNTFTGGTTTVNVDVPTATSTTSCDTP
jgi:hypothetical protein